MNHHIALKIAVDFSTATYDELEKELIHYNKNRLMIWFVLDDMAMIRLLEQLQIYAGLPLKKITPQFLLSPSRDVIKEVVLCIDCTKDITYKVH